MKFKTATEVKHLGTPSNLPLFMIRCDLGKAKVGSRQVYITWGLNIAEADLKDWRSYSTATFVQTRPGVYEIEVPRDDAKNIPLCFKGGNWVPAI